MKIVETICSGLLEALIAVSFCPAVCFAEKDSVEGRILMEDGSPAAGIKYRNFSIVLEKFYWYINKKLRFPHITCLIRFPFTQNFIECLAY